jgi:hypothetical protein
VLLLLWLPLAVCTLFVDCERLLTRNVCLLEGGVVDDVVGGGGGGGGCNGAGGGKLAGGVLVRSR